MKYSQLIGIIAALGLIGSCYLPWTELVFQHIEINGFYAKVKDDFAFGHQWIPHTFFASLAIIFFAIPATGAKRANILIAFINLAWAIKNFIIFSLCKQMLQGECPQIRIGLILLVVLSVIILVMAFLPNMDIKYNDD